MTHVFLAAILGPLYFVLGLSFLVYSKAWMKLFKDLSKNHFHRLPIALAEFILAMVILLTHNAWEPTPWILITLTGWGMLLESVFYLLAPGDTMKTVYKWFANDTFFQVGGVICALIGGYLSWVVFV